mmetsp:Transcript_118664/g.230970  ORF Transcript_118664/g.230970 Transcript_118664/m.230970 type:complete len:635 (+) Transcript_118664:39-1943(+)
MHGNVLKMPLLALHRLHANSGACHPEPLDAESVASAFVPSSRNHGDLHCNSLPGTVLNVGFATSCVPVQLRGRYLRLASPGAIQKPLVSLLLAEVERGIDSITGLPLVAICAGNTKSMWLLTVSGGEDDVQYVLATMGAVGAVRLDFSSSYILSANKLGSGTNNDVFVGFERNRRGSSKATSTIRGVIAKEDLAHCAVKVPRDLGQDIPELWRQELTMLASAQNHPNILKLHGLFRTGVGCTGNSNSPKSGSSSTTSSSRSSSTSTNYNRSAALGYGLADAHEISRAPCWALITDKHGLDLHDMVAKHGLVKEATAQTILCGLVGALEHVHNRGIIHRDIKPENVLISNEGEPVLADFGIACELSDTVAMRRLCGSPGYVAPEMLRGRPYGMGVDIFGLGALLFFLLAGYTPFMGRTQEETVEKTLSGNVNFKEWPCLTDISRGLKSFILRLLSPDANDRPTADEASHDSWLRRAMPDSDSMIPTAAAAAAAKAAKPATYAEQDIDQTPSRWAVPCREMVLSLVTPRPPASGRRSPRSSTSRGTSSPVQPQKGRKDEGRFPDRSKDIREHASRKSWCRKLMTREHDAGPPQYQHRRLSLPSVVRVGLADDSDLDRASHSAIPERVRRLSVHSAR